MTQFGVSGLLYNNNLILYDRTTESHWSQILELAVQGSMIGKEADNIEILEMTIQSVSLLDQGVFFLAIKEDPGVDYLHSSFEQYRKSDQIFFPIAKIDESIPFKERVIGVTVGNRTKVYRFSDFALSK